MAVLQDLQDPLGHLDLLLHLTYRPPFANVIERLVAPYGLVAKAGVWYLVSAWGQSLHVHPVADLLDVRLTGDLFERPGSFDLAAFWETWSVEYERLFSVFTATVRVSPRLIPELPRYFGGDIRRRLAEADPPDEDGWVTVELSFPSFEAARERLLSLGRAVEVAAPYALRRSIRDYAEQIVDLYTL